MSTFEEIHQNNVKLNRVAASLHRLSECFWSTGNEAMGVKLGKFAEIISEATENMNKIVAAEIDRGFKDAQQSSANMLNAALVMSQLQEQKRPLKRKAK